MTQKILARRAGLPEVRQGQLIRAKLDLVLGNDITAPVAINEFEKNGFTEVFDSSRVAMVMDHFTPNKDIKAAAQCAQCRAFARSFNIENFFDVGEMGVEHALLPEKGLAAPGEVIIGADSHTCTYGALGAFSTGVGSTDLAAGMATGEAWFRVPSAIRVNITGKKKKYVCGKDVALTLIGMLGVDGARYQSLEFCGEGVGELTVYDRLTVSNMAIEAGAKNGIFPVDGVTREYLSERVSRPWTAFSADPDAEYARAVELPLDGIDCTVAWPHLPENARSAREGAEVTIDQIVIGSCTNGQIDDMAAAAEVLRGRRLARGVRGIVIPATQSVYRECIRRGYTEVFLDAGCVVSTPTCGPCLGGHMGCLAAGERCVSTTNRNFVGRIGDNAFSGCTGLTDVVIPGSVTSIGGTAFLNVPWFDALTDEFVVVGDGVLIDYNGIGGDVAVPDGIKYLSSAFIGCTALTGVRIPDGVTVIGSGAFYGCTGLISASIPDSVTKINSQAFQACTGLTDILIPDSVTYIGYGAFHSCHSLTGAVIPGSVASIGIQAFAYCDSLASVTIAEGVTRIEDNAFIKCTGLTSVYLPCSIAEINDGVFAACDSLSDVYYSGSKAQWSAVDIGETNSALTDAEMHYGG